MTAPVVIAGAGVAGCGLALGLRRAGIACVVVERRPFDDGGAGAFLSLASSGVLALRALDAGDAVDRVSTPVTSMRVLDGDGAEVARRPLGDATSPAYRLLSRGALAGALAGLAVDRGVRIRYDAGVVAAEPRDDGVDVTLSDGAVVRGSLLVGADGVHSVVRRMIDPAAAPPRPVGQRVYWGTTPEHVLADPGEFVAVRHGTTAFGAFGRPDGTWWYARRAVDDPAPDTDPVAVLLGLLGDGPAARTVRGATAVAAVDAHDLPYVGPWYADRMLVVGDAAHAASPATGRGASMALEDVVVLAKALRDHDGPDAAAATYERARRGRTQANVLASAAMSRPDRPVTGAAEGREISDDELGAQLTWA